MTARASPEYYFLAREGLFFYIAFKYITIMAHTHLEQVATAAGLTPDAVKAIVELPADAKDFTPDAHVTALRDNVATALKNDAAFYEGLTVDKLPQPVQKALEAQQYGRAATIARTNMLKTAGLKEDDFKELGEEGKKLDVFIPALIAKFAAGKITDKQLQEGLQKANQELEELKGQLPTLEKKYADQYETKVAGFQNSANVLATIAQVPGLKVPASLVGRAVQEKLAATYALVLVNGQTELRQLSNPQLKVLVDNGTKELTLERAVTEILNTEKAIDEGAAKKATTKETGKTEIENNGDGTLKLSTHVNGRLAKRLEQESKTAK